jgi:hypothetical protein
MSGGYTPMLRWPWWWWAMVVGGGLALWATGLAVLAYAMSAAQP